MSTDTPVTVERATLDNGLRVVVVPLDHLHTATVVLYTKGGSRVESPAENGLSHFVEHMLFRGTERYPSSYALNFAIESLGGTLYAETGRDYSMFQVALEAGQIEAGLELFGEVFGSPLFADIDLERKLILEELGEDYDERGVEINGADLARALMFGDHPLGQRIIGPRANVERFGVDEVRAHFERYYCARNMLLCVAGPVGSNGVVAAAARHLAHLTSGEEARVQAPLFDQTAPRYKYVVDSGSQTSLNILLRAIPEQDPDYPASLALLRALDDGMSTPLHYRLCDQLGLAYSVQASIEPLHDVALLEVSASTANANIAELVRETLSLMTRFRDEPVDEVALDKLKLRHRYELASAADDANAMAGWFGGTTLYYPPPTLEERLEQVERVTAEDLRRVAQRIIRPERLVQAVVGTVTKAKQAEVRSAITSFR